MEQFCEMGGEVVLAEGAVRLRRGRRTAAIRAIGGESLLLPRQLIAPLFVVEGAGAGTAVGGLPGVFRLSVDQLLREVERLAGVGVVGILLFPVVAPEEKDCSASVSQEASCVLYRAVEAVKREFPEVLVAVDIALDPFTDHGHDGLLDGRGDVDNDRTLPLLSRMALLAAAAGADVVAPSDMMDGRVGVLRRALDRAGFSDRLILSYAVKYASSLYGPFREAVGSGIRGGIGHKRSYQLNPANLREAMREIDSDIAEGADWLMVKPATLYLDVLAAARARTLLPLGAYHVSGEYAMVMAAAERGWVDASSVLYEQLLAIRRAGADFIVSYAAGMVAPLLQEPRIW